MPFQRSELALRLKPIIEARAKERQKATQLVGNGIQQKDMVVQKSSQPSEGKTREKLAELAGVSHDTIKKVAIIQQEASPEQLERARKGGMKVRSTAQNCAVNPAKIGLVRRRWVS